MELLTRSTGRLGMTVPLLGLVESNLGSFKFVFSLPAAAMMTTFLLIAYCTALHSHREVWSWSSWRQSAPGELRKWQMRNQMAKRQQGSCTSLQSHAGPLRIFTAPAAAARSKQMQATCMGAAGWAKRTRRRHRLTAVNMAFCAGSFLQANSQGSV